MEEGEVEAVTVDTDVYSMINDVMRAEKKHP